MEEEIGTLKEGEVHPAAHNAFEYVKNFLRDDINRACRIQEALNSCALGENRLADVCGETLNRIMSGSSVSDRYLLGLAWFIKNNFDKGEK